MNKDQQKLKAKALHIEVISKDIRTMESDAILMLDKWVYWVTFTTENYGQLIDEHELNTTYERHFNFEGEYTHDAPVTVSVAEAMQYNFVLIDAINKGLSFEIVAAEKVTTCLEDLLTWEDGERIANKKNAKKVASQVSDDLNNLFAKYFNIRP